MRIATLIGIVMVFTYAALAQAQNTNPQAVRFSDEKVRPVAEIIIKAYDFCTVVVDEWFASGMSSNIPNNGQTIVDGCATDGRTCITNSDANNVITACQQLQNYVDNAAVATADRLNVLVKPTVNRK